MNRQAQMAYQVVLVALIVVSLLLLRQNLELRNGLASLAPDLLEPGDVLDGFTAQSLDGDITITYRGGDRQRVFLYLSPDCRFCHEQMPYWRQLVVQLDGSRFEPIVLARVSEDVDRLKRYLVDGGLGAIPAALVSDEIRSQYKLLGTPMTVVVGGDGTVSQQWRGRWTPEEARIAQDVFSVSFAFDDDERGIEGY